MCRNFQYACLLCHCKSSPCQVVVKSFIPVTCAEPPGAFSLSNPYFPIEMKVCFGVSRNICPKNMGASVCKDIKLSLPSVTSMVVYKCGKRGVKRAGFTKRSRF